ncbi:MAG: hypothetical protein PHX10_05390 [Gallionellaceae bacterium]|nr:hypothetical protein [Gallionellaceae bacterium]
MVTPLVDIEGVTAAVRPAGWRFDSDSQVGVALSSEKGMFDIPLSDKRIKHLVNQLAILEDTLAKYAFSHEAGPFEHPHGGWMHYVPTHFPLPKARASWGHMHPKKA